MQLEQNNQDCYSDIPVDLGKENIAIINDYFIKQIFSTQEESVWINQLEKLQKLKNPKCCNSIDQNVLAFQCFDCCKRSREDLHLICKDCFERRQCAERGHRFIYVNESTGSCSNGFDDIIQPQSESQEYKTVPEVYNQTVLQFQTQIGEPILNKLVDYLRSLFGKILQEFDKNFTQKESLVLINQKLDIVLQFLHHLLYDSQVLINFLATELFLFPLFSSSKKCSLFNCLHDCANFDRLEIRQDIMEQIEKEPSPILQEPIVQQSKEENKEEQQSEEKKVIKEWVVKQQAKSQECRCTLLELVFRYNKHISQENILKSTQIFHVLQNNEFFLDTLVQCYCQMFNFMIEFQKISEQNLKSTEPIVDIDLDTEEAKQNAEIHKFSYFSPLRFMYLQFYHPRTIEIFMKNQYTFSRVIARISETMGLVHTRYYQQAYENIIRELSIIIFFARRYTLTDVLLKSKESWKFLIQFMKVAMESRLHTPIQVEHTKYHLYTDYNIMFCFQQFLKPIFTMLQRTNAKGSNQQLRENEQLCWELIGRLCKENLVVCSDILKNIEQEEQYFGLSITTKKFNRKRMCWFNNPYRIFTLLFSSSILFMTEPIYLDQIEGQNEQIKEPTSNSKTPQKKKKDSEQFSLLEIEDEETVLEELAYQQHFRTLLKLDEALLFWRERLIGINEQNLSALIQKIVLRVAPGLMTTRVFEDELNVISSQTGQIQVITVHEQELINLYYQSGTLFIYDLDILTIQVAQLFLPCNTLLNLLSESFQLPLLNFNTEVQKFELNVETMFNAIKSDSPGEFANQKSFEYFLELLCILSFDPLPIINSVGAIGLEISQPPNSVKTSIKQILASMFSHNRFYEFSGLVHQLMKQMMNKNVEIDKNIHDVAKSDENNAQNIIVRSLHKNKFEPYFFNRKSQLTSEVWENLREHIQSHYLQDGKKYSLEEKLIDHYDFVCGSIMDHPREIKQIKEGQTLVSRIQKGVINSTNLNSLLRYVIVSQKFQDFQKQNRDSLIKHTLKLIYKHLLIDQEEYVSELAGANFELLESLEKLIDDQDFQLFQVALLQIINIIKNSSLYKKSIKDKLIIEGSDALGLNNQSPNQGGSDEKVLLEQKSAISKSPNDNAEMKTKAANAQKQIMEEFLKKQNQFQVKNSVIIEESEQTSEIGMSDIECLICRQSKAVCSNLLSIPALIVSDTLDQFYKKLTIRNLTKELQNDFKRKNQFIEKNGSIMEGRLLKKIIF